jgi:hypothetical protein
MLPRTAWRWCALSLALLIISMGTQASPKKRTFKASQDQVYSAALKVIAEHHKVQFSSKDERIISFHSGTSMSSWGFECNAKVERGAEPAEAVLVINVQKTEKQMFAWGGGDRLADDIFKWTQAEIANQNSSPKEPPNSVRNAAESSANVTVPLFGTVAVQSEPDSAEIYVDEELSGTRQQVLNLSPEST